MESKEQNKSINNTQCIILGEDCTFFNLDHGWVDDETEATTFPIEIMSLPLPTGAVGIRESTMEGEIVGCYALTTPPQRVPKLF